MVFLVAFDARLVSDLSVISRSRFETRFHFAVTVEALCPDTSTPDLMARSAIADPFKR